MGIRGSVSIDIGGKTKHAAVEPDDNNVVHVSYVSTDGLTRTNRTNATLDDYEEKARILFAEMAEDDPPR
jgi:hypothetical protein